MHYPILCSNKSNCQSYYQLCHECCCTGKVACSDQTSLHVQRANHVSRDWCWSRCLWKHHEQLYISNSNNQIFWAAQHCLWVHDPSTEHTFFCHPHTLCALHNLMTVVMKIEILDGHKAQARRPGAHFGTTTSTHSLCPRMGLLPVPAHTWQPWAPHLEATALSHPLWWIGQILAEKVCQLEEEDRRKMGQHQVDPDGDQLMDI